MKTRSQVISLVLLLLLSTVASAEKLNYLSETAVDPVKLLPAPPSPASAEVKAELDLLVAIQTSRTPEQVARCHSEEKLGIAAFQDIVGPWFTAENLPKLERLTKHATKDTKYFTDAAKTHYDRKRPFAEDSRISPIVEKEPTPAYPSGHATRGTVMARILVKLDPSHRAEILERGRDIGWDRVIGGVHHPTDIMAGRVLGQAVSQALFDSADFQKEFDAAKAEFDDVKQHHAEPVGAGSK